jgi:hypothetical protein
MATRTEWLLSKQLSFVSLVATRFALSVPITTPFRGGQLMLEAWAAAYNELPGLHIPFSGANRTRKAGS